MLEMWCSSKRNQNTSWILRKLAHGRIFTLHDHADRLESTSANALLCLLAFNRLGMTGRFDKGVLPDRPRRQSHSFRDPLNIYIRIERARVRQVMPGPFPARRRKHTKAGHIWAGFINRFDGYRCRCRAEPYPRLIDCGVATGVACGDDDVVSGLKASS